MMPPAPLLDGFSIIIQKIYSVFNGSWLFRQSKALITKRLFTSMTAFMFLIPVKIRTPTKMHRMSISLNRLQKSHLGS